MRLSWFYYQLIQQPSNPYPDQEKFQLEPNEFYEISSRFIGSHQTLSSFINPLPTYLFNLPLYFPSQACYLNLLLLYCNSSSTISESYLLLLPQDLTVDSGGYFAISLFSITRFVIFSYDHIFCCPIYLTTRLKIFHNDLAIWLVTFIYHILWFIC